MVQARTTGLTPYGVAISVLCGLVVPAADAAPAAGMTQDRPAAGAALPLFSFDIPAQSLAAALGRYADISGQSTVFSSEMVAGRTSAAVQGRFSAAEALRRLLDGSGLIMEQHHSRSGDTFLLQPDDKPGASSSGGVASFHQGGYPGLLQDRVWQALCGDARTMPGKYRILFRFRIDQSGRLTEVQLLSSTGQTARDAAVLEAVRHVQLDAPPLAAMMQQALTMLLLPDDANGNNAGLQCHREVP